LVSSGWLGDSYLTAVWLGGATPELRTYGKVFPTEGVSHNFTNILPANEYPRWFKNQYVRDDDLLKLCRLTGGGANGAASFYDPADGMWLAYGKFNGVGAGKREYELMRGQAIERGDFVLEVNGTLIAPFAAGFGIEAINGMSAGQIFNISLLVRGDKRFTAKTVYQLNGNAAGLGGLSVAGYRRFRTSSGEIINAGGFAANSINYAHGAKFRLRIKRAENIFTFSFYDNSIESFRTIAEFEGLRVPVVPSLAVSLTDSAGIAAAVGIELENFLLAPSEDALGSLHHRVCSYNTIPSQLSSVSGAAVFREKTRTVSDSQLIVGDGWTLPGMLPRP